MPTPAAIASAVDQRVTSRPFTSMVPAFGSYMPARTRINVDLPAPFSPTSAWISPRATSSSAPWFAWTGPNDLSMSRRRMAGVAGGRTESAMRGLKRGARRRALGASGRSLPRARDHDTAGDDVPPELLESGVDVGWDEALVVPVVDVAHARLGEAVLIDAADELVVLHLPDRVIDRVVDALHHRAQHVSQGLAVLIRIDADGELARLAGRLEHAEPRGARGVKDHVGPLLVLGEGDLLSLARVAERLWGDAGVLREHGAVGADLLHAGLVACLELLDEGRVHPADEADLLGLADERGESADQVGPLLFAELEGGEVGWWRDDVARGVGGDRVVDAGELRVRILLRQLRQVVGEDEPDADHEVHAFGGQQSQTGLAVRPFAGFDEADLDTEVLLGALGAEVGAVVEGLIAASAEIEDDADIHGIVGRRCGGAGRVDEEEGDVGQQEGSHEDEQLPHDLRKVMPGWEGGKAESVRTRMLPNRSPAALVQGCSRSFDMSAPATDVAGALVASAATHQRGAENLTGSSRS